LHSIPSKSIVSLARAVIVVILVAMNEWMWGYWHELFFFALGPAKTTIFIVFFACLIALAWTAVSSLYAKPNPVVADFKSYQKNSVSERPAAEDRY
jgi:hypothetical protein